MFILCLSLLIGNIIVVIILDYFPVVHYCFVLLSNRTMCEMGSPSRVHRQFSRLAVAHAIVTTCAQPSGWDCRCANCPATSHSDEHRRGTQDGLDGHPDATPMQGPCSGSSVSLTLPCSHFTDLLAAHHEHHASSMQWGQTGHRDHCCYLCHLLPAALPLSLLHPGDGIHLPANPRPLAEACHGCYARPIQFEFMNLTWRPASNVAAALALPGHHLHVTASDASTTAGQLT